MMHVEPIEEAQHVATWNILVIDDDEDDYILVKQMLAETRGRKCLVHWAATFETGQEILFTPPTGQPPFDAVLVDYDLGLHSGLELIRAASQRDYPVPLILYTGRGNFEVDLEAMQAGATLYLTKSETNPLLLERGIRYAIERKQAEKELRQARDEAQAAVRRLRESEARERARAAELDAVLHAVPAVVWVTHDPECHEVTGNQAAHTIMRLPPGSNLTLSLPPGQQPRHFRVFRNGHEMATQELPLQYSAATGQPLHDFEEEIVFDDGTRITLLGNVTPLLDEEGRPRGAVAAFIDITGRKLIEQQLDERSAALQLYANQLERSNLDLQRFALFASHDLQEPLRKLLGFGDLLGERLSGIQDEQSLDLLDRIRGAADRMQRMIRSLLDLAQVHTHGQPFTSVDLNQVAAGVILDLQKRIDESGGQVTIEPLPEIEGDHMQMHFLLENLISNGLKFHQLGQPPRVTVSARDAGPGQVAIHVRDNGIGFDIQDFNRILEPFQRLHGRSQFQGTGIGLAICNRIIERHHGRLTAESQPGQGATFIVILPLRQPKE